jgi:IS4 transposase
LRWTLSSWFPSARIRKLAVEEGVVRRKRRVDPVALFWVVVLSVSPSGGRRLAELHRSYEKVTGCRLARSSFYQRFTPAFARLLKRVMTQAMETLGASAGQGLGLFADIREVLCIDSTVVRLHDALARRYPACRTNHTQAAAKLHVVLNVRSKGPQSVQVTSERVHDGPVLQAGRWVAGRLLLFDLGYFRYQLFDAIGRQGGYFLTRLKQNANPTLLRLYRRHRGRAIAVEGQRLREVEPRLQRQVLDVEAEVCFRRRRYRGRRSGATLKVRIVGVRNNERGTYHWYVTNLPADEVDAEHIGPLYGARWAIELLFRELKSCYRLDRLPSRKAPVIEALLYAAIITLIVSHALLAALREWGRLEDRTIPLERWARLVLSAAPELLTIVLDPPPMARFREQRLLPFLVHHAPDPNRNRAPLLERAGVRCAA